MLTLAIDTTSKSGSVALYHEEKGLLGEILLNLNLNHSETLMTSIDNLFQLTNGLTVKDVNRVAVSLGPGSFTGIRVGLACAKGLAYSLGVPLVGINQLDLIARLAPKRSCDTIVSLIDARKTRNYYAFYRYQEGQLKRLNKYSDGTVEELIHELKIVYSPKKILFLGDGSCNYQKEIKDTLDKEQLKGYFTSSSLALPRVSVMAEIASTLEEFEPLTVEPYYHSKTQAERQKEAKEKK